MNNALLHDSSPALYITLVASLPAIEWLDGGTPLLSELSMRQRLLMVPAQERELLQGIGDTLLGVERSVTLSQQQVESWWQQLQQHPKLDDFNGFVDNLLRLRTVVAALRVRHQQSDDDSWAFHPIAREIERNWEKEAFGLGSRWPEVGSVVELIEKGDALELYDWWYTTLWELAKQREQGHIFDLEAIAFYLVRWRLATDFRRANESGGQRRFMQGVEKMVASEKVSEALSQAGLAPLPHTAQVQQPQVNVQE